MPAFAGMTGGIGARMSGESLPLDVLPGSTRLHDFTHLRPGFAAARLHQLEVVGILPLHDRLLEARTRLAAAVPRCDMATLAQHVGDVEMLEAGEIGRER